VLGPRGTAYYNVGSHFEDRDDVPRMGGKTGTTTKCRDAWFTGFTPDLIVCTAVGFDPPRSLGWKMTGGSIAGSIFEAFMQRALKTRDHWTMKFPEPSGIAHRDICMRTGLLAGKWCNYGDRSGSSSTDMVFKAGTEPTEVCDGIHD
jgi:penicillin-binding protein 1A